jgi:aspartate-semialdehyde dehydrogenase
MVGSVLLERMQEENDFSKFTPHFFSTSQANKPGPDVGHGKAPLGDAHEIAALAKMDAIISCQGGDYTERVHPELRKVGFRGYWIDAASPLRMAKQATLVLDPVNRPVIDRALAAEQRDFIGGNCTVSLMLMGMAALFQKGWVEWISVATYQAASGAGAQQMRELIAQMKVLGNAAGELLDPAASILELDRVVKSTQRSTEFPQKALGAPLAGSLLPYIADPLEGGRSKEEWKGHAETNKILGLNPEIPVDGICVRVGAMRCHSQALTVKLTQDVPLDDIDAAIRAQHEWVHVVKNEPAASHQELTPAAVTGTLKVAVGRLHKLKMGDDFLGLFTVGDQLLWGAAEPLRRMLNILIERQ